MDWLDIKPPVTSLGALPPNLAYEISIFCESGCDVPRRFYQAGKAPPWPVDMDIEAAFRARKFKCAQCGKQATILSIIADRDGGAPARYLHLRDEAAWDRHLERTRPVIEERLRALREAK